MVKDEFTRSWSVLGCLRVIGERRFGSIANNDFLQMSITITLIDIGQLCSHLYGHASFTCLSSMNVLNVDG